MVKSPTVLAIDPGTKMGWALYYQEQITSGTVALDSKRIEGPGMRLLRQISFLEEVEQRVKKIDLVVSEESRFHKGVDAAHWWGAYTGTLQMFCEERKIDYTCIPVQTIKAFALGKTRAVHRKASKEEMVKAATDHFKKKMSSDNEADALWMLSHGLKEFYQIEL